MAIQWGVTHRILSGCNSHWISRSLAAHTSALHAGVCSSGWENLQRFFFSREKRENINQPPEIPAETRTELQCLLLQRAQGPGRHKNCSSGWTCSQITAPLGNPREEHHTQLLPGADPSPHGQDNPVLPRKTKRAPKSLQAQLGWEGGAGTNLEEFQPWRPAHGDMDGDSRGGFSGEAPSSVSSVPPRWGIALEEGGTMSLPCQNSFSCRGHSKLLFKIIILYSFEPPLHESICQQLFLHSSKAATADKPNPWLITEEQNFQLSSPKGQTHPWCKPELSSETNLALGDFFFFFPSTNSLQHPSWSCWVEPLVFCL